MSIVIACLGSDVTGEVGERIEAEDFLAAIVDFLWGQQGVTGLCYF